MDPGTMALLASIMIPMMTQGTKGMTGQDEKFGSTYGEGALSLLDEIQNSIKGKSGSQDITQDPNYQTGQNWLQSMFNDPEFFKSFEAPLQRQFQEQTVPDLANRFASMGSGGSLGSTGFRNQLGREGSNLSTNIAALRGGMQQQAIPQLAGYAQQPIQNYLQMLQQAMTPTNNQYQAATPGFFNDIASSFVGGATQGYGQQWGQGMANNNKPGMVPGQSPATY